MSEQKPRRCYTVEVTVGADSWDEAVRELRRIVEHVSDHGPECKMVSGGYSSGAIVTVTHDPSMTHERYFEVLNAMLETRK